MKVNKIVTAVALILGVTSLGAQAADAGSGEVHFKGSIIEAACSVAPDSTVKTVELGQIASSRLQNGGTSNPKDFTINLENCDTSVMDTVKITFGGDTVTVTTGTGSDATSTKYLGITGNASGAGIVITDGSGTPINFGTALAGRTLIEGDNALLFSAYLQGISNTITTGDFYALANFTLAYE